MRIEQRHLSRTIDNGLTYSATQFAEFCTWLKCS